MKRLIPFIALLIAGSAIADDGYYKFLRFRKNDPFLFCTYGLERVDKCWIPVSPASGTWTYTGLCDEPTEDMRPWDNDDRESLDLYIEVCPKANGQGSWSGAGDGSNVPTSH